MYLARMLFCMLMASYFLRAQSFLDDPVIKIRMQRSKAQGINEADLPPVPWSVIEPPPLPPPEIHVKDMPRSLAVTKSPDFFSGKLVRDESVVKPIVKSRLVQNRFNQASRIVPIKSVLSRGKTKATATPFKPASLSLNRYKGGSRIPPTKPALSTVSKESLVPIRVKVARSKIVIRQVAVKKITNNKQRRH